MFWKIFSILIAATVKTFFAPAMGFAEGLSFGTTFVATMIGAMVGFALFYFLCDKFLNRYYKRKKTHHTLNQLKKSKKIIMLKKKYPVWLFLTILPIMSIPVMAVVVRKLYRHNKLVFALSFLTVTLFALIGCLIFSPLQLL